MKEHPLVSIAVVVALLCGVVLTSMGLKHLNFFMRPTHLMFLALMGGLVWVGCRWLRKPPFWIGALGAFGLALVSNAVWPLIVVIWFALAAALSGRWCLRRLGWRGGRMDVYFLTGACLYGTVVGWLAHWPVNYPALYAIGLALPLWFGRRVAAHWLRLAWRNWRQPSPSENPISHALKLALAALALLYFTVALMPELGNDALWMHLFIPSQLALLHKWSFDVTSYVWATIPLMGDWLFSISYMLAGERAARLHNVGLVLLLTTQVWQWARWVGSSRTGARWAAWLFLTSPLAFLTTVMSFIEPAWAVFICSGALALCRACFSARHRDSQLVIAGLLLAGALAAKAVTMTMLPPLAVVFLWRWRAWWSGARACALVQGSLAMILLGSVPYATAWWKTGNPVFPFFNKVFRSPFWYPENFEAFAFGKGLTWDFLYQVVFHTERYSETSAGAAGFQWLLLLLPLAVLVLVTRHQRGLLILWVSVISVWLAFRSTAYLRYVYPSTALLTASLGWLMTWSEQQSRWFKYGVAALAIFVAALNLHFLNAGAPYGDFPWRTLLSETHRQEYQAFRAPVRLAVEAVNQFNVGRSPVAVFGDDRVAGLKASAVEGDWTNYTFELAWREVKTEAEAVRLLRERQITYLIINDDWPPIATLPFGSLLKKVCDTVGTIGHVTVLRLKSEHRRSNKELIQNPQPTSAQHWLLLGEARYDATAGALISHVLSPAIQEVPVVAGELYLYSLEARCHQAPTPIRMQINWANAQGRFVTAEAKTFDCTQDWTRSEYEFTAPAGAVKASVHVMSHTTIPAAFRQISFR